MGSLKLNQLSARGFDNRERKPQLVSIVRAYLGQVIISKFNLHAESI